MLITCNTVFMFGLLKNTCKLSIISISQVVKLSQKGSFLTVLIPPKRAADLKSNPRTLKKPILSAFLHSVLICLQYFFWKTELCKEKIISLSANKI